LNKILSAAVVAVIVGLAGSAQATPLITTCITDSAGNCPTNGNEITSASSGSPYLFSTSFLTWSAVAVTAFADPTLPQPDFNTTEQNAALGVSTVNSVTTGTQLYVWVTVQNMTTPTGVNLFQTSFTTNVIDNISTVTETAFLDNSNGLFGGTQLATHTFSGIGTNVQFNNSQSLVNPFSETELYIITVDCGAGVASCLADALLTIHLNTFTPSTPEPLTLSLFGAGLAGLAGIRRRRKTAA